MSSYVMLKNCQCGLVLVAYMNAYLKCLKRQKKKTFLQRVFYKDFINTDLVFSIFTTLYRIGNIAINTL